MKYRVFYSDGRPGVHLTTIDAASARMAAQQFFSEHPAYTPRRITAEAEDMVKGPVAQRLEQGTHNPLVPGSNPGGPSSESFRGRHTLGLFLTSNSHYRSGRRIRAVRNE